MLHVSMFNEFWEPEAAADMQACLKAIMCRAGQTLRDVLMCVTVPQITHSQNTCSTPLLRFQLVVLAKPIF